MVSNSDPYSTFVEMVGENYLPRTFVERVKDIQVDEFSYFQVHLALRAPVRYALHEANDPAVGQAMNVNYRTGEAGGYRTRCGKRFAPANFPSMYACTRSARPPLIRSKRRSGKHAASVFVPVPFQLKGKTA